MPTQYASSNRTELSYEEEVTFGTNPDSGTRQGLRYTGESLNFSMDKGTPEEIRADGMLPQLVVRNSSTDGSLDMLWSYDSYDDFMAAAMRSDWTTAVNVSATDIDAADGSSAFTVTSVGTAIETDVSVGQWLEVGGFTDTNLNGYFQVTATGANSITFSDPTDAAGTEAAGNTITIKGSMIRNGNTLKSFSITEDYLDAATPTRFVHTGMRVGGMSVNASVGSDLSGSFSFMGLNTTVSESLTGTTTAPNSNAVLSSVTDIKDIMFNGAASDVCFESLSIEVDNRLRGQNCIGSLGYSGVSLGSFALTGSINLYFKDKTEFDRFKANSTFSVSFRSEDSAGNAYIWTIPSMQYNSMDVNSGSLDSDIMSSTGYTASIDSTTNCMLQIDKIPA